MGKIIHPPVPYLADWDKRAGVSEVPMNLLKPYFKDAHDIRRGRTWTMMQELSRRIRLIVFASGSVKAAAGRLHTTPRNVSRFLNRHSFPSQLLAKRIDLEYFLALQKLALGQIRGRKGLRKIRFLDHVAATTEACNVVEKMTPIGVKKETSVTNERL